MTKIEQIQQAIHEANLFRSKLTPEALAVPSFTSLKIRHLLNNLGAISTNFMEVGSHKGGSFCSTVFQNLNLNHATAIDNFSEFQEGSPMQEFLDNAGKFKPAAVGMQLLMKDYREVTPDRIPKGVDLYLYDGNHSFQDQFAATIHFLNAMSHEFIFLVDDYAAFDGVKEATEDGIQEAGCEILFEQELYNGVPGDNFGWHNGFYVALLKKP